MRTKAGTDPARPSPRWVEVAADPDLPHGGADLSLLPDRAYLELVADVAAYSRGSVSWADAMAMPLPALREAHALLMKRWKDFTF